jgi:mono/diheme cytochrome c family protein
MVIMQSGRVRLLLTGVLLAVAPLPALAQEDLDKGRSGQQLFNTNCAACHKSPRGLGASLGSWSLSGFLAEHYTSSKVAADMIAGYVAAENRGVREEPRSPRRAAPARGRETKTRQSKGKEN